MTTNLEKLDYKSRQIKKIQGICNTILANACYHTKQMESQIMIAEKNGNMTKEEKTLICDAWDYRNKLAKELMNDLKEFMEYEKNTKKVS